MRHIVRVIFCLMALFIFTSVATAQQPQLSFTVQTQGPVQTVNMAGSGLEPYQKVFLTTQVLSGGCRYNTSYRQTAIANSGPSGTFQFLDTVMCDGVIQYEVIVKTQVFINSVQLGRQPAVQNTGTCVSALPFFAGVTVATTKNVDGWMLPSFEAESHRGKPLFHFENGKQLVIVDGPLCNSLGVWWHVSNRFSFPRNGEQIPTETVSWVQEITKGSRTLFHNDLMPVETILYPAFDVYSPQAVSVLSVQGQRVFTVPSIVTGKRITAIKRQDGLVTIVGRNFNGAFLKVLLNDGTQGWICSAFVKTNEDVFTIPVVDNSSEYCFK